MENMLRSTERALGVNHPILTQQRSQKSMKGFLPGQWLEAAGKHELVLTKGALQTGDELAAKDAAEYLYRQEEWIARMNPVLVIKRQTTRRDHAMNVRMMLKILSPGVEHAQEADFRSEMFGISSDLQQSRGAAAE